MKQLKGEKARNDREPQKNADIAGLTRKFLIIL
jgi:hypothetical protein